MIELRSVGSFMDLETGYIYPAKTDSTPDLDQPCHVNDVENNEFFENLSFTDKTHVDNVKRMVNDVDKINRNDLSTQLY